MKYAQISRVPTHCTRHAFTLAEIVVAVFVITIGILGIAPLINSVVTSNILARNISIATNLARQRIEEVKSWPRYDYDATLDACGIQVQNPVWGGAGNCSLGDVTAGLSPDGSIVESSLKVGDVPQIFKRVTTFQTNSNMSAETIEKRMGYQANAAQSSAFSTLEYRNITVVVSWTTAFDSSGTLPRARTVQQICSIAKF